MRNSSKPTRFRKSLIASAVAIPVAGMIFFGGTATVSAFTPDVAAQAKHYWECFGWMITDPDTHAANCLPGNYVDPPPVTKSGSGIRPPIYTTTTTTTTTTTVTFA